MSQTKQEQVLAQVEARTTTVQASDTVPQNDNVAHALSGAGGGLLSMALTYPLITLSTRAQVESKRAESSTLDAAKRIMAREGVSGLYSGLESALFGISVTNFVYYYWFEFTRSAFERTALRTGRPSPKLTTVESMIAGAIAGSATVLITNPIWVVNTRMTARKSSSAPETSSTLPGPSGAGEKPKRSPSSLGTLLSIIREEGFGRLFAGVVPALVLVINPILQYTIFEQLKNALERRRLARGHAGSALATPTDSFFLGAIGKLLATSITYPYITVKSRMHVAKEGNGQKREGLKASFERILREEGWAGLYGGIGPKVVQSVITAAFLFAFKDALYERSLRMRAAVAARKLAA